MLWRIKSDIVEEKSCKHWFIKNQEGLLAEGKTFYKVMPHKGMMILQLGQNQNRKGNMLFVNIFGAL